MILYILIIKERNIILKLIDIGSYMIENVINNIFFLIGINTIKFLLFIYLINKNR